MRQKSTKPSLGVAEGRDGSPSRPRLPDWEPRLIAFADSVQGDPFVLGQTNCSILAARAIDAMTGSNHWKKFAAVATTDESELSEASDRRTRREFEAAGFSKVRKNFEQPGDILIGWKKPFERCAVCLGGGKVLTSNRDKGVIIIPLALFCRAYKPEGFRWA